MMKIRRGFIQGYNVQAGVTESQIILAVDVPTQAKGINQLEPMLNQEQAMVGGGLGEDATPTNPPEAAQTTPHPEAA